MTERIHKVAIVGAGTMGGGIAMCFANAGIPVVLIDANAQSLECGMGNVHKNYDHQVRRGRISEEQKKIAMNLISGDLDVQSVHDCDLVIEAVYEDMALKKDIFKALDQHAKHDAILATNTSTFDINDIAAVTSRPQDVVGLHFFSPANIMPLVEVVYTESTSVAVSQASMAIARRICKTPILTKVCYGFIGNRMMEGYGREAERMLLEGASPRKIDSVLKQFGMAMGILCVFDMGGIDVGVNVRKANATKLPQDPNYYQASQALFDADRLGQKNAKGFYQYKPGDRQPYDDLDALNIIKQRAEYLGIEQRADHTEQEIIERCLYPLLNEALNILDEGVAQSASDIDTVWILGYGFPKAKGGPMSFLDHDMGLNALYKGILTYQQRFGPLHWRPARLLKALVSQGQTLAEWEQKRMADEV